MDGHIEVAIFFAVFSISCVNGQKWNVTFMPCMSYTSLAYSYDYYGPAIDMAILDLR